MTDAIAEWFSHIRQGTGRSTSEAELGLQRAVNALVERLAALDRLSKDTQALEVLETHVETLRAERHQLERNIEELQGRRSTRRRALEELLLEECRALLDAGKAMADRKLLEEAGQHLGLDLETMSPRELENVLDRCEAVNAARCRIARRLLSASRALMELGPERARADALLSRKVGLENDLRELERALLIDHAVSRDVLDALRCLARERPEAAAELRAGLLSPAREQAARESDWDLGPDVLKEATDGVAGS